MNQNITPEASRFIKHLESSLSRHLYEVERLEILDSIHHLGKALYRYRLLQRRRV